MAEPEGPPQVVKPDLLRAFLLPASLLNSPVPGP
jgi:hypothetical protein